MRRQSVPWFHIRYLESVWAKCMHAHTSWNNNPFQLCNKHVIMILGLHFSAGHGLHKCGLVIQDLQMPVTHPQWRNPKHHCIFLLQEADDCRTTVLLWKTWAVPRKKNNADTLGNPKRVICFLALTSLHIPTKLPTQPHCRRHTELQR